MEEPAPHTLWLSLCILSLITVLTSTKPIISKDVKDPDQDTKLTFSKKFSAFDSIFSSDVDTSDEYDEYEPRGGGGLYGVNLNHNQVSKEIPEYIEAPLHGNVVPKKQIPDEFSPQQYTEPLLGVVREKDIDESQMRHFKSSNSLEEEEQNSDKEDSDGEDTEDTNVEKKAPVFHPVPLPGQFSDYDVLHPDGLISLEELINVTGARENVMGAFNDSDKDGDGFLTLEEFKVAPWILVGDPITRENPDLILTEMEEDLEEMGEAKQKLQWDKEEDEVAEVENYIDQEKQEEEYVKDAKDNGLFLKDAPMLAKDEEELHTRTKETGFDALFN